MRERVTLEPNFSASRMTTASRRPAGRRHLPWRSKLVPTQLLGGRSAAILEARSPQRPKSSSRRLRCRLARRLGCCRSPRRTISPAEPTFWARCRSTSATARRPARTATGAPVSGLRATCYVPSRARSSSTAQASRFVLSCSNRSATVAGLIDFGPGADGGDSSRPRSTLGSSDADSIAAAGSAFSSAVPRSPPQSASSRSGGASLAAPSKVTAHALRDRRQADEMVDDMEGQRSSGQGRPTASQEHAIERMVEHED
jgi:hypothetical protein